MRSFDLHWYYRFTSVQNSGFYKGVDPVGVRVSPTSFFAVKALIESILTILIIQVLGQRKFVLRLNFGCFIRFLHQKLDIF